MGAAAASGLFRPYPSLKNLYLPPLIGDSVDRLDHAKRFTKLDPTSAYHRMRIREDNK